MAPLILFSHPLFVLNVISSAVVFAFAWFKFNAAGDWGSVLHARCITLIQFLAEKAKPETTLKRIVWIMQKI